MEFVRVHGRACGISQEAFYIQSMADVTRAATPPPPLKGVIQAPNQMLGLTRGS